MIFILLVKPVMKFRQFVKKNDKPAVTINCEENWRGFYLNGILDFSLIGILAKITKILADNEIGIFVVSTFNTDYILVKSQNLNRALTVLQAAGYAICKNDENEIAGLL